jgi:tetratricopeptide (TPR) repeat protein
MLILLSFVLHAEPDYFVPEAVKSFADWLFIQGDYRRAAGEYLRFYFMSGKSMDDIGLFRLGRCYSLAGEYEKAMIQFKKLVKDFPESRLVQESRFEMAIIYFRLTLYTDSISILEYEIPLCRSNCDRLLILSGLNYLYLREWHTAFDILNRQGFNDPVTDSPDIMKLIHLSEKATSLKNKNPLCAGILSALVPGLGKMYAGKPGDGLFSLITIGIFGGMAGYSFYEEGIASGKGWIYASIGFFFYCGNIYGSAIAAAHYNREQEDIILREVDDFVETFYR